jgi:hypothetical protein
MRLRERHKDHFGISTRGGGNIKNGHQLKAWQGFAKAAEKMVSLLVTDHSENPMLVLTVKEAQSSH